jgi:hypothetical protein
MLSKKLNKEELREMERLLYYQAIAINPTSGVNEPVIQLVRWESGVRGRPWYDIFGYRSKKQRNEQVVAILSSPMRLSSVIAASKHELVDKDRKCTIRDWRECSSFSTQKSISCLTKRF